MQVQSIPSSFSSGSHLASSLLWMTVVELRASLQSETMRESTPPQSLPLHLHIREVNMDFKLSGPLRKEHPSNAALTTLNCDLPEGMISVLRPMQFILLTYSAGRSACPVALRQASGSYVAATSASGIQLLALVRKVSGVFKADFYKLLYTHTDGVGLICSTAIECQFFLL